MKFDIKALAEQHFKALVTVRVPTEELDKDNKTVYAEAKFIGRFRMLPVSEVRQQLDDMEASRNSGSSKAVLDLLHKQIEQYFIGFEPVKGQELPFTSDGKALESTPESIALLLDSKEVRDAVQNAWNHARKDGALEKNLAL